MTKEQYIKMPLNFYRKFMLKKLKAIDFHIVLFVISYSWGCQRNEAYIPAKYFNFISSNSNSHHVKNSLKELIDNKVIISNIKDCYSVNVNTEEWNIGNLSGHSDDDKDFLLHKNLKRQNIEINQNNIPENIEDKIITKGKIEIHESKYKLIRTNCTNIPALKDAWGDIEAKIISGELKQDPQNINQIIMKYYRHNLKSDKYLEEEISLMPKFYDEYIEYRGRKLNAHDCTYDEADQMLLDAKRFTIEQIKKFVKYEKQNNIRTN